MSATVTPIRHVITNCSRCDAWITEGQSTITITVARETWFGASNEIPHVEVDQAEVALLFCNRCAPLYDFKRVAVGRRNTEEDELIMQWADEAEIEAHRAAAAQDMHASPEQLSNEQIRGWILEQQWKELEAEGFFS